MDLITIKGRIALALVESIFRRAGFVLTPPGPQGVPPHLGREDLPDFAARRSEGEGSLPAVARLIEVRYRLDLAHYLDIEAQRGARSVFAHARRHWPSLAFVFVTEYPEPGRSAFQVLDIADWAPERSGGAVDLFAHPELMIYRQNVEEHEQLLRRMFALLTGGP